MTDLVHLSDLAPVAIRVEIERPGGDLLVVPLRTLTYSEWLRLGFEVPDPTPPISGVDKNGRPVFDTRHPDYLRAVEMATLQRGLRRLLAALQIDIPGDTAEQKLAALDASLDAGVARQLLGVLGRLAAKGEAHITARADTFRPGGTGDSAAVS